VENSPKHLLVPQNWLVQQQVEGELLHEDKKIGKT